MKLKGVLENSLGGFLTLRGYAKISDLAKISIPDKDFQRELIPQHREDLIKFLSTREFLFFPEIILGVELAEANNIEEYSSNIDLFYNKLKLSEGFRSLKVQHFKMSYSKKGLLTIYINDENEKVFSRIDGNHRLAAVEKAIKENTSIGELLTPFSIIFFRNDKEKNRFSRVLFNNINSKAIPVELEHNIRLILKDTENYPSEKLKTDSSFGCAYYYARKVYNELDFELIPNLKNAFKEGDKWKEASRLLKIISFLLDKRKLGESEGSLKKLKKALSSINSIYENDELKKSHSVGLLGAFLYYQLSSKPNLINSFKSWALNNHLTTLNDISSDSFVKIFDKILSSKKRTIFVSMPFMDETQSHYKTIKRIAKEINDELYLKTKLKVVRVDWFSDGTSYEITSKIFNLIDDSGYLIADLTYAKPNVYHEVGYLMGRNKALGKGSYNNFLLILNTSKGSNADNDVAFNLKGLKQIRFNNTEELGSKLKENIKKFYGLK